MNARGSSAPPLPPPPQESVLQAGEEDEDDLTDLTDYGEAEETAAEQRALIVSFKTQRCDAAAR
jgi:hypothetical protein